MTFINLNEDVIDEPHACLYLFLAGVGNEIVYAPIHRLLHTKYLYKYHSKHHKQVSPRPFGAIFCSFFEMWVANIPSFVFPLYLSSLLQYF